MIATREGKNGIISYYAALFLLVNVCECYMSRDFPKSQRVNIAVAAHLQLENNDLAC